nr:retrovirus-related Pol polyprotein from transposon TNT 1-94 [Tanacetum cinerariifolium]
MAADQKKPEVQWTADERNAANLDQRLKSLIMSDFQDNPDDEEDTRNSQEYLNDLEEEYQARALLAKSKRFLKRVLKGSAVPKQLTKLNVTNVDEEEVSSDDNEMVEVKVLMALAEDNDVVGKEGARNGEWVKISMRKCISEQILTQKKRILGVDQLIEDPSSSGQKDLVLVKSSANDTKVSIPGVERPWLSEDEGFTLPNHDTGRILPPKSQRNTTDPLVAITDSLVTNSADVSSICSIPLPPLKKLDGAEPISGPKTIKSTLKSKSTFKAKTLKYVKINKPSSTPAKGDKSSLASKVNSAPADNGCSRHMTGVKSYMHEYVEQPGPEVVFGDDSTYVTEGYGSIKCNGIVFTKVAFVNGLEYNLISISQLCDAKYIVQFDEKRGTIFNSNKEIVMIATRTCSFKLQNYQSVGQTKSCYGSSISCLFRRQSPSCEKGKHHRVSFKTKQAFTIKKCLHLLHMDLFRPVTPRSPIVKRHLKSPYEIFRGRILNIDFFHVFGCPVYVHKHKDYLENFDEKVDDGYFLGYPLVSKAFRVFNSRKQQTEETYHSTFDEKTDAIKFSKPSVDNINIAESERYPPDEYIHHYEPSQKYQVNNNKVSFIDPYERPDPVVFKTEALSDQNDHPAQENNILNDNPHEHSNHNNDSPIIENIINAEAVQDSKPTSSPVEDASAQNIIPIQNIPSSYIPSTISLVAQDRWSQDKHIELLNIISDQGAGMITRTMAKTLSAALAHECLFVDFLSEEEPKKVSESLKHLGWVDAMQDELNQQSLDIGPDLNDKYLNETQFRGFDLKGYSNSDYVGCNIDRKITSGACQLLGGKLVCCSAKKQQSIAMSSAEAEYVAAAGFYANILWIKSQLTSYDIIYEKWDGYGFVIRPGLVGVTCKSVRIDL